VAFSFARDLHKTGPDLEVKEKEADWLNKFYPSKVKASYTKREYDTMPVSPKESAMVRNLKKAKQVHSCRG